MTLAACGPAVFGQTDDYPDKLKQGCATVERCERLVAEAEARTQRCQENTIGYIRCSDARADLTVAQAMLAQREREREAQRDAEEQRKRDALEQHDRDRQAQADRARADQERAEFELRQRAEADQRAREAEAQKKIADAEAAEVERLRLLGAKGRENELRQCYKENPGSTCRALLTELFKAASDDPEKEHLAQLDQRLANPPVPSTGTSRSSSGTSRSSSGSGGSVVCNDGSLSPSCVCGGSLRGCCSHHGGVAGCQ